MVKIMASVEAVSLACLWRPAPKVVTIEKRRILIDPGHGGNNSGCLESSFVEKDFTLELGNRLARRLIDRSFTVAATRTRDETVTFFRRSEICRDFLPDHVLSLHADWNLDSRVSGMRCYCLPDDWDSAELGEIILDTDEQISGRVRYASDPAGQLFIAPCHTTRALLVDQADQPHWSRRARLVLEHFRGYSPLLIECGFSTHRGDRTFMFSAEGQEQIVDAIDYALKGI